MKTIEIFNYIKKYRKETLLVCFIIFILVFGLLWLSLGILFLFISYKIAKWGCSHIKNAFLRITLSRLLLLVYVLVISIGCEIFVAGIYRIPSNSMENSLFKNDVILVDKLVYGPKLLSSIFEVSWINLLFDNDKNINYINEKEVYKRAKGLSDIKVGDILVYNLNKSYIVVKRCVAVAGNSFSIKDGIIFINGKKYFSPETVKNNYLLSISNRTLFEKYVTKFREKKELLNCSFDSMCMTTQLTIGEADNIKKNLNIELKLLIDTPGPTETLFTKSKLNNWTLDNMGPFKVPQKEMTINLTLESYAIYGETLRKFEGINIGKHGSQIYINKKLARTYTFKQDYYFMMGDNRKMSMDSRYLRFIPEKNIIGKAALVLYSTNDNHIRWDRILHIIR